MATKAWSEIRGFSDRELEFLARRLEALAASVRNPVTAAGAALLAQYRETLAAVRSEIERRATAHPEAEVGCLR